MSRCHRIQESMIKSYPSSWFWQYICDCNKHTYLFTTYVPSIDRLKPYIYPYALFNWCGKPTHMERTTDRLVSVVRSCRVIIIPFGMYHCEKKIGERPGKDPGDSPVGNNVPYNLLSPRTFITYVFPRSFPAKFITKLRMK